jgi:glycosyltransferase involved in cell wall biosynthesis
MEYRNSEREKAVKFTLKTLEAFSIYEVTVNYTSKGNYRAHVRFDSADGHLLLQQYLPEVTFVPGENNTLKFNLVTTFYGDVSRIKEAIISFNSIDRDGFIEGGELSSAVLAETEKQSFLELDPKTLNIKKKFDLRLHVTQPKYLANDFESKFPTRLTPIIIHGFYNREDGLGAHLPNLYEKVFRDYKDVSFSRQLNRVNGHFSFLNREKTLKNLENEQYDRDFKWMNFYYNKEHNHIVQPSIYQGAKFIHVGGIGLTTHEVWGDTKLLQEVKDKYKGSSYLYVMWESDDIEIIRQLLEKFDNIVVTNNWLKTLLEDKLNGPKIHRVEHVAKYYDVPSTGGVNSFNFGYSGGLWERKNVNELIKAFNKIKTKDDMLKIHSREFVNTPKMLKIVKEEIEKDPKYIDLKNRTLNNDEYADWWNTLNCFVFASGGESYSIQPRQALMQGIPVILSKNTAHLDLLDVPGILWVETDHMKKAQFSGDPNSDVFIGYESVPDYKQMQELMIEVKENYSHWKAEAIKGGEIIRERVSNDNIKKQWDDVLL